MTHLDVPRLGVPSSTTACTVTFFPLKPIDKMDPVYYSHSEAAPSPCGVSVLR